EERRLPAAGRADDGYELAFPDGKRNVLHRRVRLARAVLRREGAGDRLEGNRAHALTCTLPPPSWRTCCRTSGTGPSCPPPSPKARTSPGPCRRSRPPSST